MDRADPAEPEPERAARPDRSRPADPRAARLKAALKANLGRRKAQVRARSAGTDDDTNDDRGADG